MWSKSKTATACLFAALSCVASAALANDRIDAADIPVSWQPGVKFDLSRDCPQSKDDIVIMPRSRQAVPAQPETWADELHGLSAKEELRPRWSFQHGASGPVLQFAAFGAGRKELPGLAHLALDWRF